PFVDAIETKTAHLFQLRRGANKMLRVIDADDFCAVTRQLKTRASHRAAEIECARFRRQQRRVETHVHAPRRKTDGVARPKIKRQNIGSFAVVKKQILAQRAVGLINIDRHRIHALSNSRMYFWTKFSSSTFVSPSR